MTETQKMSWEVQGLKPIESEVFDIVYGCKDNHIIIDAGRCGRICIALEKVTPFMAELLEIKECYEGMR